MSFILEADWDARVDMAAVHTGGRLPVTPSKRLHVRRYDGAEKSFRLGDFNPWNHLSPLRPSVLIWHPGAYVAEHNFFQHAGHGNSNISSHKFKLILAPALVRCRSVTAQQHNRTDETQRLALQEKFTTTSQQQHQLFPGPFCGSGTGSGTVRFGSFSGTAAKVLGLSCFVYLGMHVAKLCTVIKTYMMDVSVTDASLRTHVPCPVH